MSWQPGFKHKTKHHPGRISNANSVGFISTETINGNLRLEPASDPTMPEGWGPDINCTLSKPGNKYVSFDLTHMTADEIEKLRDFLMIAIELALPIAQARDLIADQGRQNGDDTYSRLYRRAAQLAFRQKQIREHDQSLFDRYPRILERRKANGDSSPGSGNPTPPVAEGSAEQLVDPNPGSQDDSGQSVLPDGGNSESSI